MKKIFKNLLILFLFFGFYKISFTAEEIPGAVDLTENISEWEVLLHKVGELNAFPVYLDKKDRVEGEGSIACDITASATGKSPAGYFELRWNAPKNRSILLSPYKGISFSYKFPVLPRGSIRTIFISLVEEWGLSGKNAVSKSLPLIADGKWHTLNVPFSLFTFNNWDWKKLNHLCLNFYIWPEKEKKLEFTVHFDNLNLIYKLSEEKAREKKKLPSILVLTSIVSNKKGIPDISKNMIRYSAPDMKILRNLEKAGFNIGYAGFSPGLTIGYLKKFNVVIIPTDLPSPEKYPEFESIIREKKDLLIEYVKEGGGLLILRSPGWQFGKDIEEMNEFLRPFNGRILLEQVVDKKHSFTPSFGYKLFWTDNIVKNQITRGVHGIFYPDIVSANYSNYTDFTSPVSVDKNWEILIYGMESAKSIKYIKGGGHLPPKKGTYQKAPPLLAVRDYGKGRIALFPVASTCYWQDAYHIVWGRGLIMKGKQFGMEGNGEILLNNLFTYLSQPSKAYLVVIFSHLKKKNLRWDLEKLTGITLR